MHAGCLTIYDWVDTLLAEVHRTEGRLYLLKLKVIEGCLLTKGDINSNQLWHLKYGHLNYYSLKEMVSRKLVEGLPQIRLPDQICRSYLAGKQSWTPFPRTSAYRANEPLELVYADLCGPICPPTLGGSRYYLLIVDDCSRLMWVTMLKQKLEVLTHFKKFKCLAEAEKGMKIKCLKSDRGGEFISDDFNSFYDPQGIKC